MRSSTDEELAQVTDADSRAFACSWGAAHAHPLPCAPHAHRKAQARELVHVGVGAEHGVTVLEPVGKLGEVSADQPFGLPFGLTQTFELGEQVVGR